MLWITYCEGRLLNTREFLLYSVCVTSSCLLITPDDICCISSIELPLCFCREPCLLKAGQSFSLTERCLSNDSIKASSGEVSPYENNSPVLSDELQCKYPADSSALPNRTPRLSRQYKLTGCSKEGSGKTSPTVSTNKGKQNSLQYILYYIKYLIYMSV